jgi:hypothetical protein
LYVAVAAVLKFKILFIAYDATKVDEISCSEEQKDRLKTRHLIEHGPGLLFNMA